METLSANLENIVTEYLQYSKSLIPEKIFFTWENVARLRKNNYIYVSSEHLWTVDDRNKIIYFNKQISISLENESFKIGKVEDRYLK